MQGQDLEPALPREPAARLARRVLLRTSDHHQPGSHPILAGVVRRDWKYVEWPEFDYQQLFNLKDDPGELRNLAADPAHAAQRSKMRDALIAWRARVR